MIVGKGKRSGKEYTAADKYKVFKELVLAVVKEEEKVDEVKKDSAASVKDAIEYWAEEYLEDGVVKVDFLKETKELVKLRVKEIRKQDKTVRNALENELIMMEEAGVKEIFE